MMTLEIPNLLPPYIHIQEDHMQTADVDELGPKDISWQRLTKTEIRLREAIGSYHSKLPRSGSMCLLTVNALHHYLVGTYLP